MLALCSKYSMRFFISISPLPVPSCSLLDSLTHSLLLISTDMIHSSLLFMTEPLWARVLSSGFERTSRSVSALTVWRILLVFYAIVHTHAHTHTQCMRGRNELGLNHTTQMKGLWPWTPKGEAAWQLKRLSWLLCDSDSAVKETTGAQNVVCELNGLLVSVIFINHYRIFCETSRDVIMKKLCKSHSLKAWIAGI